MKKSTEELLIVGAVLAAIGGVWYYKSKNDLSSNASVTLASGAMTTRVSVGGKLTIQLPNGADWAMGNVIGGLGNAAVTVPILGPGTYDLSWTDSSGQTNTTQLTVVNS